MASKLLASLFAAAAFSFVLTDVGFAQAAGPNPKLYQQRRMNRGIDSGMIKPAPRIDEQMVRKAPENIDDGIFKPGRVFKRYMRAKPKMDKR